MLLYKIQEKFKKIKARNFDNNSSLLKAITVENAIWKNIQIIALLRNVS